MRVLCMPMVGGRGLGPLTRCLAIAEEAKGAGHTVAFLCQPIYRPWVEAEGFTVINAPEPEPYKGSMPEFFKLADLALAFGWAEEGFIRASIESELQAIRDFQPDVLVSEYKITAPISAQITQLPLVSTASWADHPNFTSPLYTNSKSVAYVSAIYNKLLYEHKQPPIEDIGELSFLRSDLKIVPSSPKLEPELIQIKNLHYVGYLLSRALEEVGLPEWLERWDPSVPLIYVYLSATEIGPEIYTRVLPQTFDGTEFYAVVNVGRHPSLPIIPQPTRNIRYVDGLPGAVMRKSKLVIHHGGGNIAIGAVLAGAPSLMFPGMDAELEFNSGNIARVGCGKLLPTSSFTTDNLGKAVRETLRNISPSTIWDFASHLQQLGGPKRAWQLIEQLFS